MIRTLILLSTIICVSTTICGTITLSDGASIARSGFDDIVYNSGIATGSFVLGTSRSSLLAKLLNKAPSYASFLSTVAGNITGTISGTITSSCSTHFTGAVYINAVFAQNGSVMLKRFPTFYFQITDSGILKDSIVTTPFPANVSYSTFFVATGEVLFTDWKDQLSNVKMDLVLRC